MCKKIYLCVVLAYTCVFPQTYLSGEIHGTFSSDDYIVNGTVTVPSGRTLRFLPGTNLYFEQFSGITVNGSLICIGKSDSLIRFSTVNASPYNKTRSQPDPFDWNGIRINHRADSLLMRYVTLSYSVLGLQIDSDSTIVILDSVMFSNNATRNLSHNEKIIPVAENSYITFLYSSDKSAICTRNVMLPDPNPDITLSWRFPVRLGIGLATAAAIVSVYTNQYQYERNHEKYLEQIGRENIEYYKSKRARYRNMRNLSLVLAVTSTAGFALTFFF